MNRKGTGISPAKGVISKVVSASYKSRQNLRAHIKSKHFGALKGFDEQCSKNDKRESDQYQQVQVLTSIQGQLLKFVMNYRYLSTQLIDC